MLFSARPRVNVINYEIKLTNRLCKIQTLKSYRGKWNEVAGTEIQWLPWVPKIPTTRTTLKLIGPRYKTTHGQKDSMSFLKFDNM